MHKHENATYKIIEAVAVIVVELCNTHIYIYINN